MGWRERAEQVLGSGDTRDTSATSPHDSSENGPSVPSVSSVLGPKSSLELWRSALEGLDPRKPHPGHDANRWYNMVDTSIWWLGAFGKQAALDGWQTGCVFGVVDGQPGVGGLIDRLGTSRSLVMEGGRSRWRSFGVLMRFNRGAYSFLPPFWEVAACEH